MIKLTDRLSVIAQQVKPCKTVVDVGTDHGYIPVYLVSNNICENAIACDINVSPLNSCKFLVNSLSLQDKIKCVLSNGLDNINDEFDTVILAGTGGELISDILARGEKKLKNSRLIINPMTHSELVREWLYTNGFFIENDIVIPDSKHHYNIISAYYSGNCIKTSKIKCYLGEINDFSDKEYFEHLLNYLKNKQKSGIDYSDVISVIEDKI